MGDESLEAMTTPARVETVQEEAEEEEQWIGDSDPNPNEEEDEENISNVRQERAHAAKLKRAKRKKQDADLMEHVCDEVLDVGSYKNPEHPFVEFLVDQGIRDVTTMIMMKGDDYRAAGYNIPFYLEKKLYWLEHFMKNPTDDQVGMPTRLRLYSLTYDDFMEYSLVNEEPRVPFVQEHTVVDENVPVAGMGSNAAKLMESRRKSAAMSPADSKVTVRRSTTGPKQSPDVKSNVPQSAASGGTGSRGSGNGPRPNTNAPHGDAPSGSGSGGGNPPTGGVTTSGGGGGGNNPSIVCVSHPLVSKASDWDQPSVGR